MKWQAISEVTRQINDEAKIILKNKLEKDAAVQIPHIWSDFLLETSKHLEESQSNIEVANNAKTGGLACVTNFGELHPDFLEHNKSFTEYALKRYDQRAVEYLTKSKNPLTRKLLQQKIGNYRIHLAEQLSGFEAKLIEGKRHNMALESIEKLKSATYQNPELYLSNLQDSVVALSSLSLLPLEKEKLIKAAKEELAYAAALGTVKQSPQSLLNTNSNLPWKEGLSFEQRLKIEYQAESLLHHRQVMAQHQVQSISHAHFASLIETGEGIKGFDDLLRSSFAANDPRLLNLQEKEALYKQAFLVSGQLKNAPFDKGQEIINQLAPKAGSFDYDQKEKLYNILVKQLQQQVKQAKDDPAKLVEELFSGELAQNLPLVQRLLMRKQLQEQKGIPIEGQKYLMKAEKEEYLKKLQKSDSNEVKQQIDSIMSIGQGDYQVGLELLQEVLADQTELALPIHFYAENYLFNRDVASQFAKIIPIQKQLFSSSTKEEIRELDKELDNNKLLEVWYHDTILGSSHNIDTANLTKRGIRELAGFYQLTQGLTPAKAVSKATEKMIMEVYMSPFDGLQLPKQIIHEGYIRDLNEDYIKSSLINLRAGIINNHIAYDKAATFGQNPEDVPDKIQTALINGRWFLSTNRSEIYYAYQLENGEFQAIMENPSTKLTFKLFDLNNPESESESARQERMNEEMQELLNLSSMLLK